MQKPNFITVGAAKSATTSIHYYLSQHPDIFMSEPKEPQYFVANKVKDLIHLSISEKDDYYNLFKESIGKKIIGESSVFYLFFYEEAIKNIKKELGEDVKILIVLRNPIDRAFSAFLHIKRSHSTFHDKSFEDLIKLDLEKDPYLEELTPMAKIIRMGMYSEMIQAYKNAFKNVKIVLFDDFTNDTNAFLKDILTFLDVSTEIEFVKEEHRNLGGWSWKNPKLRNFFFRDSLLKRISKKIFGDKTKTFTSYIIKLFPKEKQFIKKSTRKELKNIFATDVAKVEELLCKNLKHWV